LSAKQPPRQNRTNTQGEKDRIKNLLAENLPSQSPTAMMTPSDCGLRPVRAYGPEGLRIADCGLAICDFGLPIAWIVQGLIVFNLRCDFF
jgi:hypothetical protein